MRILRSLAFDLWLYSSLAVLGLLLAPTLATRRSTAWAMKLYSAQALFMLERICGLRVEIRGAVPSGACVLAAKHQSFLDVLALMDALPEPAFVMKRSLIFAPIFGLYALRLGSAPVDRAGGGAALKRLTRRMARLRARQPQAQIVIFPQGSRVPPGEIARYRRGVAALYAADCAAPCQPAATNAGLFWPRGGRWRRPGVAVYSFLPAIEPGLDANALMRRLEDAIESETSRLEAEAARNLAA